MRPDFATIQTCVNSIFQVHTAAGVIELTLQTAEELPRHSLPESLPTPLSLTFSGPAEPLLSDAMYYLDHPLVGRSVWYLSGFSKAAHMSAVPPRADQPRMYQTLFA